MQGPAGAMDPYNWAGSRLAHCSEGHSWPWAPTLYDIETCTAQSSDCAGFGRGGGGILVALLKQHDLFSK